MSNYRAKNIFAPLFPSPFFRAALSPFDFNAFFFFSRNSLKDRFPFGVVNIIIFNNIIEFNNIMHRFFVLLPIIGV